MNNFVIGIYPFNVINCKTSRKNMIEFFTNSDCLHRLALRLLSHISVNWELIWNKDDQCYKEEERSFAKSLNEIIKEISTTDPPENYHENEDLVAKHFATRSNGIVYKKSNRWIGADYIFMLYQGVWSDYNELNLLKSASGTIHSAVSLGQMHFDKMEKGHQKVLALIITIILFHRYNDELIIT